MTKRRDEPLFPEAPPWADTPDASLWRGLLLRLGLARTIRVWGLRIRAPARNVGGSVRWYLRTGRYEYAEALTMSRTLRPDLPLIEFGAGLGVISTLANRALADPSKHVAVEMNPSVLPILEGNRDRNNAKFEILNAALGYDERPTSSRAASRRWRQGGHSAESGVRRVTLADLIKEKGWKSVNLLLDVEGTEFDLLAREHDVIKKHVATISVEVHPPRNDPDRSGAFLRSILALGFEPTVCYGAVIGFRKKGNVVKVGGGFAGAPTVA